MQIIDFYVGSEHDCRQYEHEILKKYEKYSAGGDWFYLPEEKVGEILARYFSVETYGYSKKQKVIKKPEYEYEDEYEGEDDSEKIVECAPAYPYKDVIDYLNQKAGTQFKDKSKDSRRHIKARFDEGFTLDDFKAVIDGRVKAWKGDAKMSEYLRPATLFGPKFESYLNAKPGKVNTFDNFTQRTYDFDELERKLTGVTG